MPGRELPESLTSVLACAQQLEQLAAAVSIASVRRSRRGRRCCSLRHEAGWQQSELAAFLGMNHQTVSKRIGAARRTYGDARPALLVDVPMDRPPDPLAILRRPVEQRQWLSIGEAAEHVGRDRHTVRNWLARGVLPNTDTSSNAVHLYLRADLDRVLAGPFRGPRGKYPDFDRLLALIAASPV